MANKINPMQYKNWFTFSVSFALILLVHLISPVRCESQRIRKELPKQLQECPNIVSFCQRTLDNLHKRGCNISNLSENNTINNENRVDLRCNFSQQQTSLLQVYNERIETLEQEIEKLKRSQHGPTSSSSTPILPLPTVTVTHDHDLNSRLLNTTLKSCINLILLNKIPAALRQWKIIEDHFLTQNNFQLSYNYLKKIIQQSYNHQRSQIHQTLIFINQLERSAQKSYAIATLLDEMKYHGHYPGKEIFTVGYFAGRSFDGDHEIWLKLPAPVKLISTLWRLKWFVKHGNKTYIIKFADAVNSPLEILTVAAANTNSNTVQPINQTPDFNSNYLSQKIQEQEAQEATATSEDLDSEIEWHFVSTAKWHWLKLIGGQGYVKVDDFSQMLVKDPRERSPGEFELHLNSNLNSFSIHWNDIPVLCQLVSQAPFAFVVQKRRSLKLAEFLVAEPKDVDGSRVIDLFD